MQEGLQGAAPANAAGEGSADEQNPNNGGEPAEGAGEGADVNQRLAHAEALISDLKKTAGVKSVKELKAKFQQPKEGQQPAKPDAPDTGKRETGDADYVEMRLQGYTPDEIGIAKKLAGGRPLAEAVKDPIVKAALDGVRATKKTEQATPEPSNRAPLVNSKRFAELPKDEQKRHYVNAMDKMVNQARQKNRTNT